MLRKASSLAHLPVFSDEHHDHDAPDDQKNKSGNQHWDQGAVLVGVRHERFSDLSPGKMISACRALFAPAQTKPSRANLAGRHPQLDWHGSDEKKPAPNENTARASDSWDQVQTKGDAPDKIDDSQIQARLFALDQMLARISVVETRAAVTLSKNSCNRGS
ncbi:hypothetical protein [Aminobacter sp. AP02]|uniref:hypothetical protein n=1 Tax=Aminobacter sp. AP02 TaxID=2135737 RepID=UPI001304F38B|nr:hypothetical protein [Aminobacter sp. AP02]